MANAAIIIQFFIYSILSLVVLISIGIFIAPIFAPQDLTLPFHVAGIASSLVRGAIVPRFWTCTPYLLFEFSMAITFAGYLIITYGMFPVLFIQTCMNDSLVVPVQETSFPALCAIAALFGFIGFEVLFFEAAHSSGRDLGSYGRFHTFLWRLLKGFGVALLWAIYGIWNAAAACQEDQPLDDEEHAGGIARGPPIGHLPITNPPTAKPPVANSPVGHPPIANPPVGDSPIGDGRPIEEASPPPPYVNTLPSIMFTSHQDPMYTLELNDGILSIKDPCELV